MYKNALVFPDQAVTNFIVRT